MSSPSEQDLSCPVCKGIFSDPVILSCSHSFCRDCLQTWWHEKQIHTCPLCKNVCLSGDPPCNLALKNLCETFQRASLGSELLCSLHCEKLRLFCLDHQELVCLICRDSKTHNNHRFRPISEAVQDHRQELQDHLMPLKEKLKMSEQVKENFDQTAEHIKVQAQITERRITDQFMKLHQFLFEEEEIRIFLLKEEEKQKSQMMKEMIEALSRQIAVMSDTIRATEEELRAADVSFLHNHKTAVKRVQQCHIQEAPEPVPGALIDEAKHLGNLSFNIWTKMKEMVSYCPLVLDPNTAHPELTLSDDLTSVRCELAQKLPDNPERFDFHICVLGSEGFTSGTHIWDVEVINEEKWGVGVMKESIQKKGQVETGFCEVFFMDGICGVSSPSLPTKFLSVTNLQKIRVQLDQIRGRLSFFNLDSNKHLYTIKQSFTGKMFPYFVNHSGSFRILPMNISVTEEPVVTLSTGFWNF